MKKLCDLYLTTAWQGLALNTRIKSRYLAALGVVSRDQSDVWKLEQAFVFVLLDRIVLIVSIKICTFIFIYERCYRICLSDIQWNILLKDNAEDLLSNTLASVRPRNL